NKTVDTTTNTTLNGTTPARTKSIMSVERPYVRSSMRSLERLHSWTKWTAVSTSGLAGSVWMAGDRAPGSLALAAAFGGALGSLLIGVGPVSWLADDAADGHRPQDRYLAPVIAMYLATLGVALWSGMWIHLALLALGAGVVARLHMVLLRAARVQTGRPGVEW
ncbi:hypothetical protein, partial [Acrocarpospora pleiomorpha]